jgi:hypothetical protein
VVFAVARAPPIAAGFLQHHRRPAPILHRPSGRHVERGGSLCNRLQDYSTCGMPNRDAGRVFGERAARWWTRVQVAHPRPRATSMDR